MVPNDIFKSEEEKNDFLDIIYGYMNKDWYLTNKIRN